MNKYNRGKHIQILQLMEEAALIIPKLINEGKEQEVLLVLSDCQDMAVAMGGHIEKLYGLQTQTVHALEEYCVALYQVSVSMDENSLIALAESIEKIWMTYDLEFPEKKEIVFMPYNASMWDSLESVWMAAKEDESCEVYVVPIPYYDRNNDLSFGEYHYEGEMFPDYVPITCFEDYDLDLRRPDEIYIHNPYDECNMVTSVLPRFYSSRIKMFTENLIYIPYFVLDEIDPKNQSAVDRMSHFCYLPGVINADRVILQSENMRQIYINEYIKAAKKEGIDLNRKLLEGKFLGLGSPKFDKVLNTKKDNIEIPDTWNKIIQKENGFKKKVVFYNTSIAAFLKDADGMIAKIKDVLAVFKENREDIVLLWRPHPLLMQTIESMRTDLKHAYLDMVQQYKDEGWGIYDESPDMNRAIVISDAYYGDRSSVLQLYRKTEKPIMIQNIDIKEA